MGKILAIVTDACNRLISDPFFQYIPVIPEDKHDIANEITRSLGTLVGQAGKSGVCVIGLSPYANVTSKLQNVFGPYFDRVLLNFRVLENRIINESPTKGTGIRALDIAEAIANRLHMYIPAGSNNPLIASEPTIILGNDPKHVSYDVAFWTQTGLTDVPPSLSNPIIGRSPAELFLYRFEVSTATFPSPGCMRLNNVNPTLATKLYIYRSDRDGGNVDRTLSRIAVGKVIQIKSNRKILQYTVGAVVDQINYFEITIAGGGSTSAYDDLQEVLLCADTVALGYALHWGATVPDLGEAWIDTDPTDATELRINKTTLDGLSRTVILAMFVEGASFQLYKDANNHAEYRISQVTVTANYYDFLISMYRVTGSLNPLDSINLIGIFNAMNSDSGAAIYWDNQSATGGGPVANPIPRTHFLYPGRPVPFFAGELVKAKAFLSGYLTSDTVSYVVV